MRKLSLLAMTALAGCNFAPQYRQPVAPVSAAFEAAPLPATADTRQATDLGWRDFFGDAQLQNLIATALERNRDLAQSVARVAQARAQYRIEDASRLPAIEGRGNATRTRIPLNSLGFGDAIGGGTGTGATSTTFDQFNAGVAIPAFEIDFWGRVRNLSDAARARYLGSIEADRAFRLSLISQVAATYYSIRAGEERIALAERSLTARREALRIAKLRMDSGVTSSIDYDQTNLLVTQAETELADLHRTVAQFRNLLTVLIGGPIDATLPEARPIALAGQFDQLDAGLPSQLLTRRPDILQAEMELRAANADIGAARAAFFPNISLTGNFGWASSQLGDLFKGDFQSWSYGGAVSLPIFDWGKRTAQVKLSRARADELTAAYQRAVQEAFREVADGLAARRHLAEQVDAQRRAVEAQRRLSHTAQLRYNNGIAIYLEVLDAERNLFAAEQQLLTLQSAALQNSVSLYIALGGGSFETARAKDAQ